MKKVVVLGAAGMLGSDLIRALDRQAELKGLRREDLDITDLDETVRVLSALSPQVVIHTAAFTDVDGCEIDPDRAHRVNGSGARNVALACEKIKASMVHISTDYVFNG